MIRSIEVSGSETVLLVVGSRSFLHLPQRPERSIFRQSNQLVSTNLASYAMP
jgi:hypothetical protein